MTRPRILLTGFGPFPGFPVNASAALVARLAHEVPFDADVSSIVLPTEWHRGIAEAEAALARFKPDIALHFGVADSARGFVVEEQALNACDARQDACGSLPPAKRLAADGPHVRRATLPVDGIVAALKATRIPVSRSKDAGAYLCNAVLYASLASGTAAPVAGFIHIPRAIGTDGPLSDDQALTGAHLIMQACLALLQDLIKT